MTHPVRPPGVAALSLFFTLGALMSGFAALLLLFPGTAFDYVWRLNPKAHEGFAMIGLWAMVLMTIVCAACIAAAVGLWRGARFGFWSAVAVLSINMTGDITNALVAHDWRTLIGVPVGGSMLAYLVVKRRLLSR